MNSCCTELKLDAIHRGTIIRKDGKDTKTNNTRNNFSSTES